MSFIRTKIRLIFVGVALAACIAAYLVFYKSINVAHVLEQGLAFVRSVGPIAFFLSMAVLPAIGFPLLAFTLSAGPVFAPQLGMPLVAVLVIVSLTVNVALTYWLARYAFRPMLESLIKRMGYSLPQVAADDHLSLAIIVRVTPGPPFFVQGYLLGLAKVPFWTYMIVSTLFAGAFSLAVLFFGESIVNGRGKMAFLAFSAFVALTVLVHWVRKRYTRGKKMADVV